MKNISFFFVLILLACGEVSDKKTNETAPTKEEKISVESILKMVPLKTLPYTDSTNFDNFTSTDYLDSASISVLQLSKIHYEIENTMGKEMNEDGTWTSHRTREDFNCVTAYQLKISDEFYCLVLSCYLGDHELDTQLITYDLKGKYIASTQIAYDEIAESISRVESTISGQEIKTTTTLWLDEKQEETSSFMILKNGEIAF